MNIRLPSWPRDTIQGASRSATLAAAAVACATAHSPSPATSAAHQGAPIAISEHALMRRRQRSWAD